MSLNLNDLEAMLRGLMHGEFSSLSISFNDQHACNYMTAQEWSETGLDAESYRRTGWVSYDERDKALQDNSVWEAHWYPHAPTGFHVLRASSLTALCAALTDISRKQKVGIPTSE
ncbi:hypothetical protein [Sphingopyxis granuli]|uniref:hypothetical protein n=1 Tax=Sphingopyxis granuli TaxID=267128 RepID=UPI001BAF13A8|nr:hypothetical protein [Sphingopyxis granuli]QUM73308.1 hypothetical protein ICN83_05325 [Sphingopyxis granuli]